MSKTIQGRAIIQSSPGVKLLLVQGYTWQPIKGHITVQVKDHHSFSANSHIHLSIFSLQNQTNQTQKIHQEHDEVHEELHPQIMNPNFPEHNSTSIPRKSTTISSQTDSIQQPRNQISSN